MSYVPNNLDVFTAAYSGAVAGFGAGARATHWWVVGQTACTPTCIARPPKAAL